METTVKTCKWCGLTKPVAAFYKHPGMTDGRLNKCSECCRALAKENRTKNIEYWREHDRERAKDPGRRTKVTERNRNDPRRAHRYAISNAVRGGRVTPLPCWVCGEVKTEAHHASYAKGMELCVIWLCQLHHQQCHGRDSQS